MFFIKKFPGWNEGRRVNTITQMTLALENAQLHTLLALEKDLKKI